MVHVLDVPGKSGCGCTCPACGAPLVAINQANRRVIEHFRHKAGHHCALAYESSIHRTAKQILAQRRAAMIPDHKEAVVRTASDGKEFCEIIHFASREVIAQEVWLEHAQEGVRPDVVFCVDGHLLNIEVCVRHAVDEDKTEKLRANGISTMEIDISALTLDNIQDMHSFADIVCNSMGHRKWVFSPRLERLKAQAAQRLEALISEYEAKLQEARTLRSIEDANETLRLARVAESAFQEKILRRQEYQLVIDLILNAKSPDWILDREQHLQDSSLYELAQPMSMTNPWPLLTPVEGAWIINARYQDWQSYILDQLFPSTPQRAGLTIETLTKRVVRQFGVYNDVFEARKVEERQRLHPNAQQHDILFVEEFRVVPIPIEVIARYVLLLSQYGLTTASLSRVLGDRQLSLQKVLILAKKKAADEIHLQRLRTDDQYREAHHSFGRSRINDHILAVQASELHVLEQFRGEGKRCSSCYLVSPSHTERCLYCSDSSLNLRTEVLDLEFVRLQHYRLRCSPQFIRTVEALPELRLDQLKGRIDSLQATKNAQLERNLP